MSDIAVEVTMILGEYEETTICKLKNIGESIIEFCRRVGIPDEVKVTT